MSERFSYQSLLFFLVNSEIRLQLERLLEVLNCREPITGTAGFMDFSTTFLPNEEALFQQLETLRLDARPSGVIVVSDQLTVANVLGGYQPSSIAQSIREKFRQGQHLCGLVALVSGDAHRAADIDRTVAAGNLNVHQLKRAITKTAMGLWMKSPPGAQDLHLPEHGAIRVHAVQSRDEMRKCLALRYEVYDLMGYLPEDVANCGAAIEMDSFDINAIHFTAIDTSLGETVGTARLVLQDVPRFMRESVVGAPQQTRDSQGEWCREIAEGLSDDALRDRIEHPYFTPLPILQSIDFKERWAAILHEVALGGELSRVVVAPSYRGLGVSRLLVRMAIATAVDLEKQFLLLECVPTHAKMYAQYGFALLEGQHCRAQELDQVAVGMRLDLQDTPLNGAVSLARRDIAMLKHARFDSHSPLEPKFLCLCRLTSCWRDGSYESRGAKNCPLHSVFNGEMIKATIST